MDRLRQLVCNNYIALLTGFSLGIQNYKYSDLMNGVLLLDNNITDKSLVDYVVTLLDSEADYVTLYGSGNLN